MPSPLFAPLALGAVTLPNRIVLSPMCQYSAEDGVPNDWHMIHLGRYATARLGLIFTEATHVSARGRITPGCAGLWNDAQQARWADIVRAIKGLCDTPVAIQLAHAGRKGSSAKPWEGGKGLRDARAWATEAPSAIPHVEGDPAPEALDDTGLARVTAEFVASARRAVAAGFDVIELHAAHGYLLNQFLSPIANQRGDGYGGTREKRMRFPLEVFEAVRAAVPASIPVGLRISATDWMGAEGFQPDDAVAFLAAARDAGCAFADVSSGGVSSKQKVVTGPGYQVPFSAEVKRRTGLPTMAVGLITDPHQAERIVAEGSADMVALARGLLADPLWAWRAADALGHDLAVPVQYMRGRRIGVDTPRDMPAPKA